MSSRALAVSGGLVVIIGVLVSLSAAPPAAAVGTGFTYQGRLNVDGAPANGVCNLQFVLFNAANGGGAVASVGPLQVNIEQGLFTVTLDFGAAVFTGNDRWIEIRAQCPGKASQTLQPRQPITAAPYALYANSAGAVPDGAVTSAKIADGTIAAADLADSAVTGAKIANGAVAAAELADGAATTAKLGDAAVTGAKIADGAVTSAKLAPGAVTTSRLAPNAVTAAQIADGQVTGAKLAAPLRLTSSAANTTIGALDGTSTGSNGVGVSGTAGTGANSAGVLGTANAGDGVRGTSSTGIGVKGTSETGDAIMGVTTQEFGVSTGVVGIATGLGGMHSGVRGESTYIGVAGFGDAYGVQGYGGTGVDGLTDEPDGQGVRGQSRAANDSNGVGVSGSANQGIAVRGQSASGIGMHGLSSGSGADGVRGTAEGTNGNGVHGIANNGTGAYGVFGQSTSGFAGYFSGKVTVTGNLSKGGGSFIIDHPLDPAHKYLSHSFVESPDMKNIYDGIAVLDADGRAEIELPDWFQALNRDFRYQLTCIGAFAPVYVAEEIHDNRFAIAGGAPGQKISWLVTGIRQDAYANAHRIVVEENKPAEEVGHYLHPAELGMPASMSTTASKNAAK